MTTNSATDNNFVIKKSTHLEKQPFIFLSTPCYGGVVTMHYMNSVINLISYLSQKGIKIASPDITSGESLIPRARNYSVMKFMNTECTHLLFIDADIDFSPMAIADLIAANKDVACCAYPKKGINWNRILYSLQNEPNSWESLMSRGLDFCINETNTKIREGDFIRVKHAGTGCMLIKREIIQRLQDLHPELECLSDNPITYRQPYYALFACMIKDKCELSEDYAFCERVIDAGGEVWLNTKHNLGHVGIIEFESDISNRRNIERTSNDIFSQQAFMQTIFANKKAKAVRELCDFIEKSDDEEAA